MQFALPVPSLWERVSPFPKTGMPMCVWYQVHLRHRLAVTEVYSRALLILIASLLGGLALYFSRDGVDTPTLAIACLSGIAFLGASLVVKRK